MLPRMSAGASVVLAVAITLSVGGCGRGSSDPVRAKVAQFVAAVRGRDYSTICDRVLAPTLLADLAQSGVGCEQAMRIALTGVNRPSLQIRRVTVSGDTASALTVVGAAGESAERTSIQLIRTPDGWRVSALRSPVKPAH
jgi:hypothetical protein